MMGAGQARAASPCRSPTRPEPAPGHLLPRRGEPVMDAGSLPLVETSPAVAIGPFCLPGALWSRRRHGGSFV